MWLYLYKACYLFDWGQIFAQSDSTQSDLSNTHWYQKVMSNDSNQPCLCLCLGFSQITRITPFLLITLHFSHIGLTEDLTFICNSFLVHSILQKGIISPSKATALYNNTEIHIIQYLFISPDNSAFSKIIW